MNRRTHLDGPGDHARLRLFEAAVRDLRRHSVLRRTKLLSWSWNWSVARGLGSAIIFTDHDRLTEFSDQFEGSIFKRSHCICHTCLHGSETA